MSWNGTTALGGSGKASAPACAIDAYGNAVVVWLQRNGTRNDVWSSMYNETTGWSAPLLVEKDNGGSAFLPGVTSPAPETFVAVWQQGKDSNNSVTHVHTATLGGNANVSVAPANLTAIWSAIGDLEENSQRNAVDAAAMWDAINATRLELAGATANQTLNSSRLSELETALVAARAALDALNASIAGDRETVLLLGAMAAQGGANDTALRASVAAISDSTANLSASIAALRALLDETENQLAAAQIELARVAAVADALNQTGGTSGPPRPTAESGAMDLSAVVSMAALMLAAAAFVFAGRRRGRERA